MANKSDCETTEVLEARVQEAQMIERVKSFLRAERAISADMVGPFRGKLRIHADGREEAL